MIDQAMNAIGVIVCMGGIVFAFLFAFGLVCTIAAKIASDISNFIRHNRTKAK